MSILSLMRFYWRQPRVALARWRLSRQPPTHNFARSSWIRSLVNPSEFYLDSVRYFDRSLPEQYQQHRYYFNNTPRNRRGFGEDAFHVLWYLLLNEIKPRRFLEIGVYRGQVISLAGLWARLSGRDCEIFGISPFTAAGDSVSKYSRNISYYEDTLANFAHFDLKPPTLLRGLSTDPEAHQLIESKIWDLIYIDGNHEYEIARGDLEICSRNLRDGGVIVLDDSALSTAYIPPRFGSAGHPGPSRLAQELKGTNFHELLQVGHNRAFQLKSKP